MIAKYTFVVSLSLGACLAGAACSTGPGTSVGGDASAADAAVSTDGAVSTGDAQTCTPLPEPDAVEITYQSLPPGERGPECWDGAEHLTATWIGADRPTARVERCVDGKVVATERALSAADVTRIRAAVQAMCDIPLPPKCFLDGEDYTLTIPTSGGATGYKFDDINCLHRTDVRYAKGDIRALRTLLRTP
jgi:hypothetical protein